MKKRLFSLLIAIALLSTMALPAMAASSYRERYYGSFQYFTTDTCNARSFHCVIESYTSEYTLATNVTTYTNGIIQETFYGVPHVMVSSTGRSLPYAVSKIGCFHIVDGNAASDAVITAG